MANVAGVNWDAVESEAVTLLRDLLRIDTTNPPGNEHAAAEFLAEALRRDGFAPRLLTSEPGRTSVIARLSGTGERGPLLLQGHTDVVPADPSEWSRPPFSGDLIDGCVWGRGALDMKGTLVMQLLALLLARRTGLHPRGDIIFCAVPDEETGGFLGAGWLVDNHPDLVRAEVALGEVGGFTLYLGQDTYYPIQVAEKVGCALRLRTTGPSGHGSLPIRDGAMAKAARVLGALTISRLPLHLTPIAEQFIRTLSRSDPTLLGLLDPQRIDGVLAEMGADGRMFEGILHNTAVPTVVMGGGKSNVIPGYVDITVDGRLLPGQSAEAFIAEVRAVIGDEAEIVDVQHTPSLTEAPVDAFFAALSAAITDLEPAARPVPTIVTGVTDARHFARLGTRAYGFAPVKLRPDLPFWTLFHSADERIPVEGLRFGVRALFGVLARY